MTTIQIISRRFGVYFSKPVWSFIRNCVFWLFHLNKISAVRADMKMLKALTLDAFMKKFLWQEDVMGDWTPWVSTILCNDFQDDCDGAAALSKWWFKQHDIKADIFNLYSDKSGHTVCVTRDRTKMVSNDRVLELNPANWEKEMLKYFGGKYTEII
jgi:hypothetical protein